jgi:hypothetical protein
VGKKDGKEWLSLDELSSRLGRLREIDKEERERAPLAVLGIRKMWEALAMQVLQVNDHKKASGGNDIFQLTSPCYLVAANAAAVFDLCWQLREWQL